MMNKLGNFKSIFLLVMVISFISSCGSGLNTITMDFKEGNNNTEIDLDIVPPGKVKMTGMSSTWFTLTVNWTDPGSADLDHIRVSWDPSPASQNVAVGTETLTVGGLTSNTEYTFIIAAVDSAGNESPVTISAKTVDGSSHYFIYTAGELYNVRNDLGGYYNIMDDIDLSGYPSWTPIGDDANRFEGTLDGGGHIITGLTINAPASDNQGLFGYIGESGADTIIKNVNIDGFTITGNNNLGALAGEMNYGTVISNCHVKGTISGATMVGGLIGIGSGNLNYIRKSSARVTITITGSIAGGLISMFRGDMSDSYARGSITSAGQYLGGLIGVIQTALSSISDSYASVTVAGGIASNLGGIMGCEFADPNPVITGTYCDQLATPSDNSYGLYVSTANMKLQSTYTGWDFVDTWGIDPLINDGYPYLKSNQLY